MRKTLPIALAVSVLLNLVLLVRRPAPPAPRPAPAPVAAPPASIVDDDTDKILLREEVRLLRNQLAVTKAKREIDRTRLVGFATEAPSEDPDTRDFQKLMELVESFIEERVVDARDREGRVVKVAKPVLPPPSRDAALRALEDYLGLEGATRRSFHGMAESAIDAYHRLADAYNEEMFAASKAAENDEFFEDEARRRQEVADRLSRRTEEWMRGPVQSIRDLLDRRDGIRPALLSESLSSVLSQLGSPDER